MVIAREGGLPLHPHRCPCAEKAEQYEVHYFTAKSYPDPAEFTRKVEVLATFPDQDVAVSPRPSG